MSSQPGIVTTRAVPAPFAAGRGWQRWAPYAAVAWAFLYAVLGIYWALGGAGYPYTSEASSSDLGPLLGRLGPSAAWIAVILAGVPALALGTAMLRGVRRLRTLLISAGVLLAATLLLLMTSLDLLVKLGYAPYVLFRLVTGAEVGSFLAGYVQWITLHQVLCLIGGFIWLAATVSYARRSSDACLACGRTDQAAGWTSPISAQRWGRTAVYVGMVAPIFYALTRYAWAAGIPLGLGEEQFRRGQESGQWTMGALFLGSFCLVGALLMLGLVQRWGEIFPRWMIGLAGREVPLALPIIFASLAAVLLIVGGTGIWAGLGQMVANSKAAGATGSELTGGIIFQLGPTLMFPLWGVALAFAALGYYYRRRGPCQVCGRGVAGTLE